MRHLPREALSGREPCHVTLKVVAGLRTLRDVRIVRALEATFRAVLGRPDFRVVEYSIQDDHLHLLVEADDLEVRRALAYVVPSGESIRRHPGPGSRAGARGWRRSRARRRPPLWHRR